MAVNVARIDGYEPTLELHSRAAPSVEAHQRVNSPDTGRNSGGKWIKKFETVQQPVNTDILHTLVTNGKDKSRKIKSENEVWKLLQLKFFEIITILTSLTY